MHGYPGDTCPDCGATQNTQRGGVPSDASSRPRPSVPPTVAGTRPFDRIETVMPTLEDEYPETWGTPSTVETAQGKPVRSSAPRSEPSRPPKGGHTKSRRSA